MDILFCTGTACSPCSIRLEIRGINSSLMLVEMYIELALSSKKVAFVLIKSCNRYKKVYNTLFAPLFFIKTNYILQIAKDVETLRCFPFL